MVRQLQRDIEHNNGGFSLIEGMLASVILAISLLSLSTMQIFSLGRNVDASEMTRVTNFAADIMERIQFNRRNAAAYNGIDTSVACTIDSTAQPVARGDCDQWVNLLTGSFSAGLGGIRGKVDVSPTGPTNPALNMSRVVVTMTWTGAAGASKVARPRQVAMTTVVAPE